MMFCFSNVKRLPLIFLLILAGDAWMISRAQSADQKLMIRGRVVDQNRSAIRGAVIALEPEGSGKQVSATSDERGEFTFETLAGPKRISVMADGFAPNVQALNVTVALVEPLEVVLEIANASAVVTITESSGYLVQAISSATKTSTLLRDIPQSISVVSREQIKEQSMQSLAELVAYVPGVTAHQGENNRDQVIFRGNSSSADFYLNGTRDDVQYYRDLYNVDRVEVLKGPNSMIFGRGGGGGIINRVTKDAGFTSVREITLQGGSFGNKRVTTDINQRLTSSFGGRLNALYENSNSFRRYVGLERYGVNPTATWVPDNNTRVTVSYEFFRDRRVADRGIPSFQLKPADSPVDTYFGNPENSKVKAKVQLASASVDHTVDRFSVHNRVLFGDYDRFYQNYVPGVVTRDKTKVALSSYNNATKRRNFFNQTDVTFDAASGRVKHTLLVGGEMGKQLTDNFRNSGFFNNAATTILVPYDNPTINTPVTFRQSLTDADNHLQTNLAAGYVQDQIEFSRYFRAVTGVRFDYFDLRFHNNRTNEDLRRIDRLVSPRAGLIFKPVSELSVYTNFGVAYLPSAGDQFSSLTVITSQLKPEKFTNYELGAKWDIRSSMALTTAIYRQDRTNTRASDPNDPTRIVQTGSQRTNGYELALNGTIANRWAIVAGYGYQNAFITHETIAAKSGAQVAQVPHHTFSLWNNYKLQSGLSIGLGIVHRSEMFAAVDNTVVLLGYTRVDAAVFYSIGEHWRLQANIQNIFDKTYYANADNNNNISPGSPRAIRLSLVTRF